MHYMNMRKEIISNVKEKKLIAIIREVDSKDILNLAKALYEGGINMIEVTFVQNSKGDFTNTTDAIRLIAENLGNKVYPGAGTVLTTEQVRLAKEAGARYIVTPNTDEDVIGFAKELGLVTIPGALTATEAVKAHQAGADFVKLFPIGNLGASYIKALRGPLKHIPFVAVGGVNENNVKDFIDAGAVGAGIGGNLVNKEWIRAGEYEKITALARKFVEKVQ